MASGCGDILMISSVSSVVNDKSNVSRDVNYPH
jgi:hypothetical protein